MRSTCKGLAARVQRVSCPIFFERRCPVLATRAGSEVAGRPLPAGRQHSLSTAGQGKCCLCAGCLLANLSLGALKGVANPRWDRTSSAFMHKCFPRIVQEILRKINKINVKHYSYVKKNYYLCKIISGVFDTLHTHKQMEMREMKQKGLQSCRESASAPAMRGQKKDYYPNGARQAPRLSSSMSHW